MRVVHKLRYEHYFSRIKKRIRSFFILTVLAVVLFSAGTILKNIALNQIKDRLHSTLSYTRLYLTSFPPALVMEDVRSVSSSPFFSAEKVLVKISLKSLFSREKPFDVFIEHPVLSIYQASQPSGDKPLEFNLALPFVLDRGLIRNGELYYWGEKTRLQSRGIDALFTQEGEAISLKAEISDNWIDLGDDWPRIEGRIDLALEGDGEEIRVDKLRITGPYGVVKADGQVLEPLDPVIQLRTSYNLKIPFVTSLIKLPFDWEGRGTGKGILTRNQGQIDFQGDFTSKDLILSDVVMGNSQGRIRFNQTTGGSVELNFRKQGLANEYLKIDFNGNRLTGAARGVYLDPIMNFLQLPWPVTSPAWGEFSIRDQKLSADIEFRDELVQTEPERFPFAGQVHLEWDGRELVTFSSQNLNSTFASLAMEGNLVTEKSLDISIQGDLKDGIQARRFTELILQKEFLVPELRGEGHAELHIFGDFFYPQLKANFTVAAAGFDNFNADHVYGEVELIREDFFGRFDVDDPAFKGRIGLFSNIQETKVEIWVDRGRIETILPPMDILLPIQGEAEGHFEYRELDQQIEFTGSFSGKSIIFAGQELTDVSGKIIADENLVDFPELQFGLHEGRVQGAIYLEPISLGFNIDLKAQDIDLSTFNPQLQGQGSIELRGKGTFGQDVISGNYVIENLLFLPFQPTRSQGEVKLDYVDEILNIEAKGSFFPGDNMYTISLGISLQEDSMEGEITGAFQNMDLLLPWQGAKGQIDYLINLQGSRITPQIKGAIDVKGSLLPFPNFAHALRDFSGLLFVDNGHLSIRSFQGKFGGGDVSGSGSLHLGLNGIETIDVRAEAKDMSLALLERTAARAEGNIRLLQNEEQFVLEGDFLVNRLSWRREITEKFFFSSSALQQPRREPTYFDDMTLNIRLRADDNAWMDNALGRVQGRFDLTLTGNVYNPVVLGDIEVLDGTVDFQDRRFQVLNGRVSFINPATIDPYISFRGETFVKDYRVTITLDGLLDNLNPEFTSSPPLPPEDVLALIALGEAFQRSYHYDQAMSQGTASLLSFTLSEDAKRRAQRIFAVDQFRIDPFVMGSSSEVTARLTVGKRISRNFFILYATNLSTERRDIVRIELEISRDLSLVGIRDEDGRLSFDVKIHKRF